MTLCPRIFSTLFICLIVPFSSSSVVALETKTTWDTSRTSSPESVDEMRALETRVKQVVKECLPTTVGLLIGNGAGSGVIVRKDGLVLTAAHVIGRPDASIQIVLSDGSVVRGKSLGLDSKLDTGMVKITDPPPKNATWPGAKQGEWPVAKIGKASDLKKGQWVVALGHPGGPKKDRPPPLRVGRFEKYDERGEVLRTDCTLVGGDSGGPLFNLDGEVVGIHSRIGTFLEFNMHVSADAFVKEWDELARGDEIGKSNRARVGIILEEDTEQPTVKEVEKDGPADRAGMMAGDVLLKFKGKKLTELDDLFEAIDDSRPNQEVTIEVKRGDKTVTLKVKLGRRSR